MPAATSKRVKGFALERKFIIGNVAHILPHPDHPDNPDDPTPPEFTKGWTVYVRPLPNGPDIRTWLKKVQFKLHHTYRESNVTIEASTLDVEDLKKGKGFEVKRTGYGEFSVEIRLYFAPEAAEKAVYREHYLVLGTYGTPEQKARQEQDNIIIAERLEVITFNNPTLEFFKLMTDEEENFGWLKVKKGRGKGKKPEYVFEGDVEPTAQLPEKPPAGSDGEAGKGGAWSQQFENQTIAGLKDGSKQLDQLIADEQKKAEERRETIDAQRAA
ncbi:hypothetical protein CLAFUW4_06179 [Fulvia fulva]|uniref:Protein AF-9 homolog n=1 Tax=Passalora fulva TaxID=5499 RepID=A0A9Q8LIV3_PASFU|nr:uncharacterized protein CLAFUR5_06323 [Fulvia fulva]KAK4624493.1 hypothetical protein CLAFUR4_06182 [Fulvia fulva]KAK4625474.1 hypothetical protein CLAFUR0_06186 [Fulvia fulva]UJO18207.1 hypothetical protein CLAFUR5_06323 [Fulvia fulva]WPV14657.1 hypothetical protein CLAFUW4_06179 [Fulvia fulva]WPV30132.1 hypothetical protein CLAFUW7_06175 [Fulvia fulva]